MVSGEPAYYDTPAIACQYDDTHFYVAIGSKSRL
jgi:hypothetical protein